MLTILIFLAPPSISYSETFKATVTPINDREYTTALLPLLKNATGSIQVIMYSANRYLNYPDSPSNKILDELKNAAGRHVKVEVILNRREKNPKIGDGGPDNQPVADDLAGGGAAVFFGPAKKKLHAKMIIVDGRHVVIGSANWSYSALAKNRETDVVIDSPELAKRYVEYFKKVKKESRRIGKIRK